MPGASAIGLSAYRLSHAALAEEGGHVVVAKSGADLEGHELWRLNLGSFYAQAMADSTFLVRVGGHEGMKSVNKKWAPRRADVIQAGEYTSLCFRDDLHECVDVCPKFIQFTHDD